MKTFLTNLIQTSSQSGPEMRKVLSIIEDSEAYLLSEKAGSYTALGLLNEMKLRKKVSEASGKVLLEGVDDLIQTLEEGGNDNLVSNYVFKYRDKTAIIYLNSPLTKIIGAIIVQPKK